jgi:acyl-CoA thioesterase FadM
MRLPPRRIHLSDTDATGFAYAGRLVDIALQRLEEGLAASGIASVDLIGAAAGPAVVHLETDFRRPARLGDKLAAMVACQGIGETSATFSIILGPVRTPVCIVTAVLVWVDRAAGTGVAWPPALRRKLAKI